MTTSLPAVLENTVISTRIRLARNLAKYPFPSKLTPSGAKKIISAVRYELNHLDCFTEYDIKKLSFEEGRHLIERHLISPDLLLRKELSAAFVSSDNEVSVMVNEEDHLREQYILRGFDLYKAYERIGGIDDGMGRSLGFAYDERLGFLTACPTNLGTGMRASVMMFLPGLFKYKKLKELMPWLKRNGLTVRGVYGEGSSADGYFYQVSNERTLGLSEADILSCMENVAKGLAEMEARMRIRMLEEDRIGYRDMCLRSFGTLANCGVLSTRELETGMVKVRLGAALGFFKVEDFEALQVFLENMRPVSFKIGNCAKAKDETECDILRAKIVNKVLPKLVLRVED